jgi:L-asparaginase
MKLLFIQTGGTIDKDYPHKTKGWDFVIGEPAFLPILQKLNPSFDYDYISAFKKDSLEMTDDDRTRIVDLISEQPADAYIITHGTDTLKETADYLQARVPDKRIILTGAVRPERFSDSDAPINLGAAIAAAHLIDGGVFITMHGVVKKGSEMKRDSKTGKFY